MNSKILLRIAAALILLHLLGHSVGHFTWDTPDDPNMQQVVNTMKGYSAEFMGAKKSMADYYHGYSLIVFGLFGMTIAIQWLASGFIGKHRQIISKILYPVAFAYLAFGIIEFITFFPFAALLSFMAGILTLLAITIGKSGGEIT